MKRLRSRAATPACASAAKVERLSTLEPGDATILPAGTGHQCLEASDDLLVVGAYPGEGVYDLCLGSRAEHERATVKIPGVRRPDTDPFFGRNGPLLREWE